MRLILQIMLSLVFTTGSLLANALTMTGAELYTYPDVRFPTIQPRVVGPALMFDSGNRTFEKLFTLPVLQPKTQIDSPIFYSVSMNLTMRECIGACLGRDDWDPIFVIGDNTRMFGIQLGNDGSIFLERYMDLGLQGSRYVHEYWFSRSAPRLNESIDIRLDFVINPSQTELSVYYDGPPQSYLSFPGMNFANGLFFAMLRDNDYGEQHQINSISVVPEPNTFTLLITGVIGVLVYARSASRRSKPSSPF